MTLDLGNEAISYDHAGADHRVRPAPPCRRRSAATWTAFTWCAAWPMWTRWRPNGDRGQTRLLIVGGGYIGLEAAAVCGQDAVLTGDAGRDGRPHPAAGRRAGDLATIFRNLHSGHGVDIREGVGLDRCWARRWQGDRRGAERRRARWTWISSSSAWASRPDVGSWRNWPGSSWDNGISGGCAGPHLGPVDLGGGRLRLVPVQQGNRIRLESVAQRHRSGELVAQNMLGADKDYVAQPWFWSDQYDVKLQIAGLNTGYDNVVTRQGEGAHGVLLVLHRRPAGRGGRDERPARLYGGKRLIEAGKIARQGR